MSVQDFFDYLNSQTIFEVSLLTILWMAAIGGAALVLERLTSRYLRRLAKRARFVPNEKE